MAAPDKMTEMTAVTEGELDELSNLGPASDEDRSPERPRLPADDTLLAATSSPSAAVELERMHSSALPGAVKTERQLSAPPGMEDLVAADSPQTGLHPRAQSVTTGKAPRSLQVQPSMGSFRKSSLFSTSGLFGPSTSGKNGGVGEEEEEAGAPGLLRRLVRTCLCLPAEAAERKPRYSDMDTGGGANQWRRAAEVKWYIIDPKTAFMRRWDTFMLALLLFTAIITPAEVAFRDPEAELDLDNLENSVDLLFVCNRIVDFAFVIDFVMNFFLGYYDEVRNVWVFDHRKIINRYLKTWFLVDVVSIFPYDFIQIGNRLKVLRVVRLMRLAKLLRILRAARIFRRLESSFALDYSVIELLKFVLVTLLTSHWFACAFSLVANLENGPESWLTDAFPEVSDPLGDIPWHERYVVALYWSAMTLTTIGYGDIRPVTQAERIFSVVAMLIGGFMFGYVIGAVSGVLAARNERVNKFRAEMKELNQFLEEGNIPSGVRQKLREFFKYKSASLNISSYHHLLQRLSPALRQEVARLIDNSWIERVIFFQGTSPSFQIRISMAVEHLTFPPGEIILQAGEMQEQLMIVKKGLVASGRRVVGGGGVFGEEALYKRRMAADFSSHSITFCDLYVLQRFHVMQILEDFPVEQRQFQRTACRRLFRTEVLAFVQAHRMLRNMSRSGPKVIGVTFLGTSSLRAQAYFEKLKLITGADNEHQLKLEEASKVMQRAIRGYVARRTLRKLVDEARALALKQRQLKARTSRDMHNSGVVVASTRSGLRVVDPVEELGGEKRALGQILLTQQQQDERLARIEKSLESLVEVTGRIARSTAHA
mmetsp:Transcript_9637/g.33592  ORF Transcript_9637/g.33592 Transcript_9637/m.33592 type:complete len:824 (+) Transcript_9637:290-2761(+)